MDGMDEETHGDNGHEGHAQIGDTYPTSIDIVREGTDNSTRENSESGGTNVELEEMPVASRPHPTQIAPSPHLCSFSSCGQVRQTWQERWRRHRTRW